MSTTTLRILCCFLCLALVPYARSMAQEGGERDRDRPGAPGGGPGGPGGPGGVGGPREHHRPEHEKGRAATAPRRNGLQFGPVGRWWDDRSVIQAIGLRRE